MEQGEENTDEQNNHEGIWWSVCLGTASGTIWGGRVPGTSGTFRADFFVNPHRLDRMSKGQTGHFHDTSTEWLQSECGGVPPNFFMFSTYSLLRDLARIF